MNRSVLLAIVTTLALPLAAWGQTLEVSARSGLNVRKGPGLQHRVLKVAPNATLLLAAGETKGKWHRVSYGEVSGWVHGDYVLEVIPFEPTDDEADAEGEEQVVTASALNFRSGPSTGFESFGLLPRGTKVEVIGEHGNWRKVRVNGQTAWVHGHYLGDPGAAPPPAPSSPNLAPQGNGNGSIRYNGRRISDQLVRTVLQRIADHFGSTINVTSGDRTIVPPGGSATSWHLQGRACDFHVDGYTDEHVFNVLLANRDTLLREGTFELIWHTAQTNTSGQHLHIANRAPGGMKIRRESHGNYVPVN